MPGLSSSDTIRILVATDNHVGYNERDAIRGDDSWKTFHEIMCMAKDQDVDMVLLAGDLFHDNKPSRKSMFNVMRSLRMTCMGDKPCELELLSDSSEVFQGAFNHVNYEDPDMNVAIPVFSIHGNHDDPSGEGHLAALDILQTSGLVNYYGRTPESDNIQIKPVLLQKGQTKLALYGMSNVRDERLFRTFRDGNVKFYQPGTQKEDWFNLMSVHQNHHAHTDKGYLPENFLPDFLDLVIWGHEHECLIEPTYNPEMGFHVMQPGSSIATSLMPGEAVPKKVAVLSITGRDFKVEPILLKTVRPFIMREIVLKEEKEAMRVVKKANHRSDLTKFLESIVLEMIEEAKTDWQEAQGEDIAETQKPPLPLIRLRVEFTSPEGYTFDCENPQRFSNKFSQAVANVTDVIQYHRKKAGVTRRAQNGTVMPEQSTLASLANDSVRIEKIIREFLSSQTLTLLPQNSFGDAVAQYVDKDDKHAMESFIQQSLEEENEFLAGRDDADADDLAEGMGAAKSHLETLFENGLAKLKGKRHSKPDDWDSDLQGEWENDPKAIVRSDAEDDEDADDAPPAKPVGRGRGKAAATRADGAAQKKAPTRAARGKKKVQELSDEDSDVVMVDGPDSPLFVTPEPPSRGKNAAGGAKRTGPARAAATRATKQSQLNFSQAGTQSRSHGKKVQEIPDDISEDDDSGDAAFEPMPPTRSGRSRK